MRPLSPFVLVLAGVWLRSSEAHAQPPTVERVFVLRIESDGPDEQATALTQALSGRVRRSEGWSLAETQSTFEVLRLTHCPPPRAPDAACLDKVASVLGGASFVWGEMRPAGADRVAVTLHLHRHGHDEATARQEYPGHLRDANDEVLKKIAAALWRDLTEAERVRVSIRAGAGAGTVMVDGVERERLEGGAAKLELRPGHHTIEVRVPGSPVARREIDAQAAENYDLVFEVASAPGALARPPTTRPPGGCGCALVGAPAPGAPWLTTVIGASALACAGIRRRRPRAR